RYIGKASLARVREQLIALRIRLPESRNLWMRNIAARHPAVHYRNIEKAILIEIRHHCAKARAAPFRRRQTPLRAAVPKQATLDLSPKCIGLRSQMRDVDVEESIVIDVPYGNTHAREAVSREGVCHIANHCFFGKPLAALIDPQA